MSGSVSLVRVLRHLGASPDQLARSRRAHFARRLLDDTDLTVLDIAFASGFGSLRPDGLTRTFRGPEALTRGSARPGGGAAARGRGEAIAALEELGVPPRSAVSWTAGRRHPWRALAAPPSHGVRRPPEKGHLFPFRRMKPFKILLSGTELRRPESTLSGLNGVASPQ
ncbi:helix-turn-helix domain-containing protein [Nonomuraea sp. NPDC050691]|uniref:helix-turn-helix domain-containing protein n=1 Tax=Nonomuraea sp. NPDC050691 TaxID=3155661 RepID=UPI0033FF2A35